MDGLRRGVIQRLAPLVHVGDPAAVRRPFDRVGLLGRTVPFAAVAFAGVLLVAPWSPADGLPLLGQGALVMVLAIAVGLALSVSLLPAWLDVVPPLLGVVAVAILRHGAGGASSGLVPLFAVPIIWVALYGSRIQIVLTCLASSAAVFLPIAAFGPPAYPPSEWSVSLLNGAIGLLVGLTVNSLVTRLHAAAELDRRRLASLAEAKSSHQAMVEAANDAIVTVTPDGTIVDVNPAALEMFRGGHESLIGENLVTTLATADERGLLRMALDQAAAGEASAARRRVRIGFQRVDGEAFQAELSLGVVHDERGWLVHAFARDVTDLVAVEAERQREFNDLGALLEVGRDLARPEALATVRTTVCSTAMAVSDAAAVLLFEPQGDAFVATASAGRGVGVDRIGRDEPSGVATASASGKPLFSGRFAGDPRVSARVSALSGAKAGYWQPIRGRSGTEGVLVAIWDEEMDALPPRVERLLNIVASQAQVALELATLVERLENLARHDPLTGLANRRTLDASLAAELDRAARSGRPLSLVMLDLDHFKAYNDAHGHPAGDALLVAAAGAWQRELRPSDLLVRYGGEEFTAVLPDCSHAHAVVVAERLRAATPAGVTASAGVATARAGESPANVVGRADVALYRAKEAGRNQTVAA
ncbi:MAG TPA: diguanylate cyclase [Candidatus Limnocylindrales bacterium]|nr:diguanylate cyclase [Candidatus Limnocylindrales bacterium]